MGDNVLSTFLGWLDVVRASPGFEADERTYKIDLAARFRESVLSSVEPDPFVQWLRPPNNIVGWRTIDSLVKSPGLPQLPDRVRQLLDEGNELGERIDAFASWLRETASLTPGDQVTLASVYLMGGDPLRYPPFKTSAISKAMQLAGWPPPRGSAAKRYLDFLRFCDEIVTAFAPRGQIDRLDVQGVSWVIGAYKSHWLAEFIPDNAVDLDAWRGSESTVYQALDRYRSRCLIERRSFTLADDHPSTADVWTQQRTRELIERFVDSPNLSDQSFMVKLREQLSEVSVEACQLLVDLTWLHLVIAGSIGPVKKRQVLNQVAAIRGASVPDGTADRALEYGIANTGMSYIIRRPNQLWLLIRFVDRWLSMSVEENRRLLADPWAFRDLVFSLPGVADQSQRHALLHLIHPATFEPIVSQNQKQAIVDGFAEGRTFDNVDRALVVIRVELTPAHGEGFSFYADDIRPRWDVGDAAANRDDEPDEADEPDDAVPVGATELDPPGERRAWFVRGSGGERVPEWLHRGVCAVYFEDFFPFAIEPGMSREELRRRAEDAGVDTAAGGFNQNLGQVWRFVNDLAVGDYVVTVAGSSIYLGIVASGAHSTGNRARRETWRQVEWLNADQPVSRAAVPPPVQPKLKTLLTLSNITSIVEHLEAWASGSFPSVASAMPLAAPELSPTSASTTELALTPVDRGQAERLLLPEPWLNDVIGLLQEKRQIIFYGPPGTGKTYLAQKLADHVTADGGTVELVQFHPSYAYEDFFEGFRPVQGVGGTVTFELKPGPLRRIAEIAAAEPTRPHVLVIDELNRANLPTVFGELYFLLEYRDRAITLQYSDEEFTLPPNLFVIGTMNTADRSIALVDAAMRRRFYFVGMMPSERPVDGMLRRWLSKAEQPAGLADLLDELNRRIDDPDAAIGPSFLMTGRALTTDGLDRIWSHAILPLLQDRFYGTADGKLQRFQLSEIRAAVARASDEPPPPLIEPDPAP